jgi:hypothetical protein
MSVDADLGEHLRRVARAILKGSVVPVLGAGANLCDRGSGEGWTLGSNLPSGAELAEWLARELECRVENPSDLLAVSQYADLTSGAGELYGHLHQLLDRDYPIPSLHRFLASLPARMAAHGLPRRHMLIVTTNYDDLMERALVEAGEPFDVVRYLSGGPDRGLFVHDRSHAGPDRAQDEAGPRVIKVPKRYDRVSSDLRTVVMKIHGAVDRMDESRDSYVITEDDYIDYLTRTSPNELIPVRLLAELLNSHFLFLGYAMRDWNLRVLLHRIWGLRDRSWSSWAVQRHVESFDEKVWARRQVELRAMELSGYVESLTAFVDAVLEDAGALAG